MQFFQVISFVLEIIFGLILAGFIAFFPEAFGSRYLPNSNKKRDVAYVEYSYLRGGEGKKPVKLGKGIWILIIFCTTIYLMRGYFLDVPLLITGKLEYITGTAYNIRSGNKEFYEYVDIAGKGEVKFFFDSGVTRNRKYKIGYLYHTSRAIYCAEVTNNVVKQIKAVGFPFKKILFVSVFVVGFYLLMFRSLYIRWKLFIPACILFYPSYLYVFVKYGLSHGYWFSRQNEAFVILIMAFLYSLLSLIVLWLEKLRHDKADIMMVFVQIAAIGKIVMVIRIFIKGFG